jgi:predicted nucleic acid-binding protein
MKVVVSDTSPINYLVLIGVIDFLPKIFESVIIPAAVYEELSCSESPLKVQEFLRKRPKWLKVEKATKNPKLAKYNLDQGEFEAISIAIKFKSSLLIDEKLGRIAAEQNSVKVFGTIGLIAAFAKLGYLDFEKAIKKLAKTNFRVSKKVVEKIRQQLA